MFLLAVAESLRCSDQHYMSLNVLDNMTSDLVGRIGIDVCRKRRDCLGKRLVPLLKKGSGRAVRCYLLINGPELGNDILGRSYEPRLLIICERAVIQLARAGFLEEEAKVRRRRRSLDAADVPGSVARTAKKCS